jgi:hypothetical protein
MLIIEILTFGFKVGLPLKGSIAYGNTTVDLKNNIYFGQPIIDSYLLQDDLKYMGVVCHNSIESKFQEEPNGLIFECKTPFGNGKFTHKNINWFISDPTGKQMIQTIKNFRLNASGSTRKYIDNTIELLEQYYKKKNDPQN